MFGTQVLVIGGAVADVSLCAVDPSVFTRHSTPIDSIRMSTGGDALNEAAALARMGDRVRLSTVLGQDPAGTFLFSRCAQLGVETGDIVLDPDVTTSINAVLVDERGERCFVTAKDTSLRRLNTGHVLQALNRMEEIQIVSFASMFVSPCLGLREMENLFHIIKQKGKILCADMTRCKNGETAEDLRGVLQYVDFLFPNLQEGRMLTGEQEPEKIAQKLMDCGAKHIILKLGSQGCYVRDSMRSVYISAYPVSHVVDTTGAGDTFAAAFIHCLLRAVNTGDCARFASAAASICVEHPGCDGALPLEEIERRMEQITARRMPFTDSSL